MKCENKHFDVGCLGLANITGLIKTYCYHVLKGNSNWKPLGKKLQRALGVITTEATSGGFEKRVRNIISLF